MAVSFWDKFKNAVRVNDCSIDYKLNIKDTTLESLFTAIDFIDELRNGNEKLVDFLSQDEIINNIITNIISNKKISENDNIKNQSLSAEILKHNIAEINNKLLLTKNLNLLFKFLEYSNLNDLNCIYFSDSIYALMTYNRKKVMNHIKDHSNILDNIIKSIDIEYLREILILIGWNVDSSLDDQLWLFSQNLIPRLLDLLSNSKDYKQIESIFYLINNLIFSNIKEINTEETLNNEKKPYSNLNILLLNIESKESVIKINEILFKGDKEMKILTLNILINLLKRNTNKILIDLEDENDDKSSDLCDIIDEDKETLNDNEESEDNKNKKIYRSLLEANNNNESGMPPVVEEIFLNLDKYENLLNMKNSSDNKENKNLNIPLGYVRYKIAELVLYLIRIDYSMLVSKLKSSDIIPILIELFFQYEWNNMFHKVIENIINVIVCCESNYLKLVLFNESVFLEGIVEAYEKNERYKKNNHNSSLGYMGTIYLICSKIELESRKDKILAELWRKNERLNGLLDETILNRNNEMSKRLF